MLSEAREYDFASVCVNPTWVEHAKKGLEGTDVKVCTVVGFPLGATTSAVKAFETKEAIQNGADEIDMVINVGALKSGNLALVESDIRAVVEASGDKLVKVIIEACLLTDQEKLLFANWPKKLGLTLLKHLLAFQLVVLR
ncbi:deoxyribose-phosphate aldolase [Streptococcus pneumoniae GA17328]|nr:deoxyribose-phosphate aldolase [Streptococcus pneumoniae GA47368]EHE09513.1 deoxyribose-phosphate aldolase [Streptococcus pneumoniae GA17328]